MSWFYDRCTIDSDCDESVHFESRQSFPTQLEGPLLYFGRTPNEVGGRGGVVRGADLGAGE